MAPVKVKEQSNGHFERPASILGFILNRQNRFFHVIQIKDN